MIEHDSNWQVTLPERVDEDNLDKMFEILEVYGRERLGDDLASQIQIFCQGRINGDLYMAALEYFIIELLKLGISPMELDLYPEYQYYLSRFPAAHREGLRNRVAQYLKGESPIKRK